MSERSGTAGFGRYELRGVLGQGGFATVYRAWDPALGREVALKALLPHLSGEAGMRERFLGEGRALAGLHQANIVTVYDVGEAEGRPFFAMELIDGPTVAQWLDAGRLSLAQALPLLRGLASALDYLHAAGLVHRDIKPANVMIDASGRVVLMDFGIVRMLDRTQLTTAGASLGTPQYMAPEQVRGEPAGPAADIYALGVLAYQLFAGRPPFEGDTAYVLHAQAYEPPPPLPALAPGLPPNVYAAIASALQKQPRQRPQQAGAFIQMLEGTRQMLEGTRQMLEGTRRIVLPPPADDDLGRTRRGLLWSGGGALVAVLLVAGIAIALLTGRHSTANNNSTALQPPAPTTAPGAGAAATATAPIAEGDAAAVSSTPQVTPPSAPSPRSGSSVDVPAGVTPTAQPRPAPPVATSDVTLQNLPVWIAGNGALQTCFSYRNATPGLSAVRTRIVRAADRANPLAQSTLVPLNADAGQQCAALDSIGTVPAGDYVALLYDQVWNAGSSFAFTVSPPPPTAVIRDPIIPTPPPPTLVVGSTVEQIGLTADDPQVAAITIATAERLSGNGVRLLLSFRIHTSNGWTGDNRPENRSGIYLTDESGNRTDLIDVSGDAGSDSSTATAVSGWYRFGSLAPTARFVWLHYTTSTEHNRDLVLGVALGNAAPSSAGATPARVERLNVGANGADTGALGPASNVAAVRAEGLSDGSVRLLLSFLLDPSHPGWLGDNTPENRAQVYLTDERGRRYDLATVNGPAGADEPDALTISGWYRFGPLSGSVQQVVLHYGSAIALPIALGQAAPAR